MLMLNGKEKPHTLSKAELEVCSTDPRLTGGLTAAISVVDNYHVELEDSGDNYLYYEGSLPDGLISVRFEFDGDKVTAETHVDRGGFGFGSF